MKTLYLIRHAKSSWKEISLRDFDRPLNSRGKKDAPEMGLRLKNSKINPDAIVTSPANRACTTAFSIAKELNFESNDIQLDASIYEASASTLLRVINKQKDIINVLFLVGHNPGITYLAELLSNESFGNIPTCAVVGITFPFDNWELISGGTGTCSYYNYPKKESH